MKQKKLLSLLLAVCMALALLPAVAHADTVEVTDELTADCFEATDTTYKDFSDVAVTSDAKYAGNSARTNSDGIQLRSKNGNSGIVSTVSDGKVKSITITVESGSNTLDVYGSNTAYASAADLYDSGTQGIKLGSLSADGTITVDGDYAYIGLRSNSGALYLTRISITWEKDGDAPQPTTYTVSFDANGGEGAMADQTTDGAFTLPACTFTAPEGKMFDCWKISGDDTEYAVGAQVAISADTTFVAVWKEAEAITYRLVTSGGDIEDGATYLIASEVFADAVYVMSNQTTNNRAQYKVSNVDGNTITLDAGRIAADANDALAFEFTLIDEGVGYAIYDAVTGGYLYAASSSKNWLRTETELDDNGKFAVAIDGDGASIPFAQGENTRNYLHYNSTSGLFSCYAEESNVNGAVYFYKRIDEKPVAPEFVLQSLILSGMIGVGFNVKLPEIEGVDYATSYMTFSVPHGTCTERVNYNASEAKGDENRKFVCYVTAVMMAEPITATFHYTENGTKKTVEKTYAVKDYFAAYEKHQSEFDTTTCALIESIADYGHYTQALLAVQKGWTFGTTYLEMDKRYTDAYDLSEIAAAVENKGIVFDNDGIGFKRLSYSMLLDSATGIRFLFRLADADNGTLTVSVDGEPLKVNAVNGSYEIVISSIPANLLSKTYEICFVSGDGSATISVSGLSYVKQLLTGAASFAEPDVMQNAAAAICRYSAAADAYKAAH